MNMIDIRSDRKDKVNKIVFADESDNYCNAQYLVKYEEVIYMDGIESCNCLAVCTEEDAKNLIKALQKAIELGWWKA